MADYTTRLPVLSKPQGVRPFWVGFSLLVVILAGAAVTLYTQYLRERNPLLTAAVEPEHVDPVTDLPVPSAIPVVDVPPPPPVSTSQFPQVPLPALEDSDPEIIGWMGELFSVDVVARFLVPENVIRNIVVTIDNLPRASVNVEQRPVAPTPGRFVTTGTEEEPLLAPENYERYEPFMGVVRSVDAATIVALYRRFGPLFQEAYENLGYPTDSFDARIVEVIDHLLGTPEVAGPIRLVQPRVMYEYADPDLEAQSAGRKLLIRMGPDHAAALQQKLREIREELARY